MTHVCTTTLSIRMARYGGTVGGKAGAKGCAPSPNLNPKLQGMTVATHVDDIITRGARAATVDFWTVVAARFPVREWSIVEFDNPVNYCAKRIRKIQKRGKVWYTMDQTRDIEVFLTDAGITGVRATTAPMPTLCPIKKRWYLAMYH